jgi:hypothetical protein
MDYVVTWEIQISAKSAREAAELALQMQRDPNSTATVFQVFAEDADPLTTDMETIDLSEPEEEPR